MQSPETSPFPDNSLSDLALHGSDGEVIERLHLPTGSIVRHIPDIGTYFDVQKTDDDRVTVEPAARITQIKQEYNALETEFGVRSVGFAFVLTGRSEITDLWVISTPLDPTPNRQQTDSDRRIEHLAGQALHAGLTAYWVNRRIHETPRLQQIYRMSDYTYSSQDGEFVLAAINPYVSVSGEEAPETEHENLHVELQHLREMGRQIYTAGEYVSWNNHLRDSLTAAGQTP